MHTCAMAHNITDIFFPAVYFTSSYMLRFRETQVDVIATYYYDVFLSEMAFLYETIHEVTTISERTF